MTTLYPVVQSAKITILYLYLYWGKPFSASERSGRECFPCWTWPVLPRLWYCCGLPSCRARLPVIGLPFSSHHLSALWIQLQGPKRTTTLQLKRLICPRPSLPLPPRPPTACYVFISTHLCFCVAFPLNFFPFFLFWKLPFVNTVLHGKGKCKWPLAYFCLSRLFFLFFIIVLNGCKVLFFIASSEQFQLKSAQFLINLRSLSIKEAGQTEIVLNLTFWGIHLFTFLPRDRKEDWYYSNVCS